MRRFREWFETDRKDAAIVNREFLDWLARRPEPARPYFAFLNYFDAHSPYQLPPRRIHRFGVKPTDGRERLLIRDWWDMDKSQLSPQELSFAYDAYDDCVAALDEQVGRLFDELDHRKALDRTWVILVSDHGESFGEHSGVFCHGASLYQTELHVPLVIIPPPGLARKLVVPETASLRDLAATIVHLAGQGTDSPFPGASLARFWDPSFTPATAATVEPEAALAEVVPNETLLPGPSTPHAPRWPLAALADGDWSYIRREGDVHEQLFHLRGRTGTTRPRDRSELPGAGPADAGDLGTAHRRAAHSGSLLALNSPQAFRQILTHGSATARPDDHPTVTGERDRRPESFETPRRSPPISARRVRQTWGVRRSDPRRFPLSSGQIGHSSNPVFLFLGFFYLPL